MRRLLPIPPVLGLALGLTIWEGAHAWGTWPVLLALGWDMARSLRRGAFGLDAIAALAMLAALLMGEALAANVVALMYAGGQFLEAHAQARAGREMETLLARQPRTALRLAGNAIAEVPIAALRPGDRLLVPRGAVLPVDAVLEDAEALLDEAALTGEAMPVRHGPGAALRSGSGNAGDAFRCRATSDAAASTYAGILRLVRQAQAARAPMARLADRWALGFLLLTLLLAGGAWAATGDARRALAVLVVATPCPLILAVPVALMAGVSRCASLGVLVKSPAGIEAMARIQTVMLDKTGTLTLGAPVLAGDADRESLRVAASLDQGSTHPVAAALVAAAQARGIALTLPADLRESPGEGVAGLLDGVPARAGRPAGDSGGMAVAVALGGRPLPPLLLEDPLRPEAPAVLAALRAQGVARLVLASGDAPGPVREVAARLGITEAHAGLDPAGKLALLHGLRADGPVMMLGDGVNDAPALAAAALGVAVAARGAAAAEAADAVLLADGLARLPPAMAAARRAVAIARQGVVAGIGLSVLAMLAAAWGLLPPVQGALVQEGIDVAVILNALRALNHGRDTTCRR